MTDNNDLQNLDTNPPPYLKLLPQPNVDLMTMPKVIIASSLSCPWCNQKGMTWEFYQNYYQLMIGSFSHNHHLLPTIPLFPNFYGLDNNKKDAKMPYGYAKGNKRAMAL